MAIAAGSNVMLLSGTTNAICQLQVTSTLPPVPCCEQYLSMTLAFCAA